MVATKVKCTTRIAKGSKGILTPTYQDRKTQYGSNKESVTNFWFCSNDIERYVKGTKHSWVLDWPQVLDVWLVLSGTNLTRHETLLLQDARFKLQKHLSMSPRHVFTLSNLFECLSLITLAHQIWNLSNNSEQQVHLAEYKCPDG